jgi:hypothetical protein
LPDPNERNSEVQHNTEDKGWWLKHGLELEYQFVELCKNQLNIKAEINPAKSDSPTAPDLLVDGKIADLKVQNTPFFSATKYSMDPRYTVTFNRKDFERYSSLYPEIVVYFWVNWTQLAWRDFRVQKLNAICKADFSQIADQVNSGKAKEHEYIHRQGDMKGNAKSSFLLDIRTFQKVALLPG